jgi:hypothetical protein
VNDRETLGIPPDAAVYSGAVQLPDGWTMDWIGVRVFNPPASQWPWPYMIRRSEHGRATMVVQLWRRTVKQPSFSYTILWHPEHGRLYHVESSNPDIAHPLRDAQRAIRREMRGRKRRRPSVERYMADFDKLVRASGGRPPTRMRMAEEYDVIPATVGRWLRRRDWVAAMPDQYRAQKSAAPSDTRRRWQATTTLVVTH